MSKLDDILEEVAVRSADQYGGFEEWETPEERSEVIDWPKQQIKDLMLELAKRPSNGLTARELYEIIEVRVSEL